MISDGVGLIIYMDIHFPSGGETGTSKKWGVFCVADIWQGCTVGVTVVLLRAEVLAP